MTCGSAQDLLFDAQEGLLDSGARAALQEHLAGCPACRAEEAALTDTYAALSRGLQALVAPVAPSPAFWQGVTAGLDAVDARRGRPLGLPLPSIRGLRKRSGPVVERGGWLGGRRWAPVGALVALLSGALLTGAPQQAWAALRQALYCAPLIGVCQIKGMALVSAAPVSMNNGSSTLTVTELVAGRQGTLLAYHVRGAALLRSSSVVVADAVDATLIDSHGQRYQVTAVLPAQRSIVRGVPEVRGMLAFGPLLPGERSVHLEAARLPLVPLEARPWSVLLSLRHPRQDDARTSLVVDRTTIEHGVVVTVTDLTFTGSRTVIDMDAAVQGGLYRGGSVVSLAPERAEGDYAPLLIDGHGHAQVPAAEALPAPVRVAVLARPEFAFGPVARQGGLTVTVRAVSLFAPGQATVMARPGQAQRVRLGTLTLALSRAEVVSPPAALGLGGQRRLRLTFQFPRGSAAGTLLGITAVVGGAGITVDRADPHLEVPLREGQQEISLTLQRPLIRVTGPWIIHVNA